MALLLAVFPLQHIGWTHAVGLSALHIGGLFGSGWALGRILAWPRPRAFIDLLTLGFVQGLMAIPLYVLFDWMAGGRLPPACLLAALLIAAVMRRPGPRIDLGVPAWVYVLALLYAAWSVGLPFRHFNETSMVRELYTDNFQRFGIAHALSAGIPPMNPFAIGLPTRYYWFCFVPLGLEHRVNGLSMFDIWRVAHTWLAFFLVPALWWYTARMISSRAATGAVLLGFVFASYELFLSPSFAEALAFLGRGEWWAGLTHLLRLDPDHVRGVVNTYSDQLFCEDFLYIPQNATALALTVLCAWLMTEGRIRAAVLACSLLAGFNTFFVIPVGAALAFVLVPRYRLRDLARLALLFLAGTGAWLVCCGVIPGVLLPWMLVAAPAAVLPFRAEATGSFPGARFAAVGALAALCLLLAFAPLSRMFSLFINYGPAFPLAVATLISLTRRKASEGTPPALVFLMVFVLTQQLVTVVLELHLEPAAPGALRKVSAALAAQLDYFNFYHKTAKGVRWAWSVLAAVWLMRLPWPPPRRQALVWVAAAALLLPAAGTTLVRPMTYAHQERPRETTAADYLRASGVGPQTRILAEDYRRTAIGQLTGASLFYISSWSGRPPGHTHAVGTWAFQYVPPRYRQDVLRREGLLNQIFAPPFNPDLLAKVVEEYDIDFVLLREKRDLAGIARLVVDAPGEYLYACRAEDR